MADFVPLTQSLKDWFETPMAGLPEEIMALVEEEFFPNPWDTLSSASRREVARQIDYWNDPAKEAEREFCWDFADKQIELEQQKTRWETIATPTAVDLTEQERRLKEINDELARMRIRQEHAKGGYLLASADIEALAMLTANEGNVATEPSSPCSVFTTMVKLTADEITIAFVGDKVEEGVGANGMLEISARGENRRISCTALDLVNRNGRLNRQGAVLLGLAQRNSIPVNQANRKSVSRLREVIREHLGSRDDPFQRLQPGKGWQPRFKVTDKRGAADERARRDAERRTQSLDQHPHLLDGSGLHDVDEDNDGASVWLWDHDSDYSA